MEFQNDKAIYLQIADLICDNILIGKWKEQSRIPSVREIAIELEVNPTISAEDAISVAAKAFETDTTDTIIVRERPSLYIFPKKGEESATYYLVYEVDILSNTPHLNMLYFVDAHSGAIVDKMNKRRDANDYNNDGTVRFLTVPSLL